MPTVLLDGMSYLEAPRWRDGKLWVSDFYTRRVLAVDLAGKAETVMEVPGQPSGLGWTPEGGLWVVSMLDHRILELKGGAQRLVADLSAFAQGPCNDLVIDAHGRAYVSTFGYDLHGGEAPRPAHLIRVDPDGSTSIAATELVFPNGMVISPDGRTLVVAETFAERLTAFDVESDGRLTHRRVFASYPQMRPDGICGDEEGAIWVADPAGRQALRLFAGGKVDQVIRVGSRGVYACMLGGEDRRTLFLCTNAGSGPAMAKRRYGRIETVRVNVAGAGIP